MAAKKTTKKSTIKKTQAKSNTFKSEFNFKTTAEIEIPKTTISQVIGQEHAVESMKKAAIRRRHVLLIGEPGTGKSMLGMALAEMLPKEKLMDILAFPNPNDENEPLIRTVPAGTGRDVVMKTKLESLGALNNQNVIIIILAIVSMIAPWWIRSKYNSDIMFAAFFIGGIVFLAMAVFIINFSKKMSGKASIPKVIVDNYDKKKVPFYDATGSHAGALLGDVLHDPFQSGGLGTPANERIIAGLIHKAHMGVLFVDEISTLRPDTQQELLSALQERKYPITGQSERSAGAMVRTEAVPCSFILVAAGNIETIKNLHPALRSRITGYGYEVYMNDTMPDTKENRYKLAQFIAQEIKKDGKIPPFSREAAEMIIYEAKKRASRKGHLTLRLRELGGIVRAAGDFALEVNSDVVLEEHVQKARKFAKPLEQQMADKYIERKKEYNVIVTSGKAVGRVNGLAVMGSGALSGIILPIEASVSKGNEKSTLVATGKLGEIAKEAVTNVFAIVKRLFEENANQKYDINVQFLQTYEGVEGDSASVAIATAILSSLKNIPIKQNCAMTGSLSVRGDVLPIGGVSAKIEAAIEAGLDFVIVPESNVQDIVIEEEKLSKIKIVSVSVISEVLEYALDWKGHEKELLIVKKLTKQDKK